MTSKAPACPQHPLPSRTSASTSASSRRSPRRDHPPVPHPGDDPAGRADRPRHHRPGQDRHRQDPRLRHPAAAARRRPGRGRLRRPRRRPAQPQALVVVPTRELAVQVAGDLADRRQAAQRPRRCTVYGGRAYEPQIEALKTRRRRRRRHARPPDRPRSSRATSTSATSARVVLDEADEMLDLGFLPDVEKILARDARRPADDAVLGDDAGRRRRAGPPLHDAADAHPRRRPGRRRARPSRPSSSSSTAPTRSTRSRCSPASCRPRAAA